MRIIPDSGMEIPRTRELKVLDEQTGFVMLRLSDTPEGIVVEYQPTILVVKKPVVTPVGP